MINESIAFKQIGIAVVTISDTRNSENDKSGKYLKNSIINKEHKVTKYEIIKDDVKLIQNTIQKISQDQYVDVIITTIETRRRGRSLAAAAAAAACRRSFHRRRRRRR